VNSNESFESMFFEIGESDPAKGNNSSHPPYRPYSIIKAVCFNIFSS